MFISCIQLACTGKRQSRHSSPADVTYPCMHIYGTTDAKCGALIVALPWVASNLHVEGKTKIHHPWPMIGVHVQEPCSGFPILKLLVYQAIPFLLLVLALLLIVQASGIKGLAPILPVMQAWYLSRLLIISGCGEIGNVCSCTHAGTWGGICWV